MRRDSDSEEEVVEVEPLPPHRIRFTDMPWPQVDQAIRRKYGHEKWQSLANHSRFHLISNREGYWVGKAWQRTGHWDSSSHQEDTWTWRRDGGMARYLRQVVRLSHHLSDNLDPVLRPAGQPSQVLPDVQDSVSGFSLPKIITVALYESSA